MSVNGCFKEEWRSDVHNGPHHVTIQVLNRISKPDCTTIKWKYKEGEETAPILTSVLQVRGTDSGGVKTPDYFHLTQQPSQSRTVAPTMDSGAHNAQLILQYAYTNAMPLVILEVCGLSEEMNDYRRQR